MLRRNICLLRQILSAHIKCCKNVRGWLQNQQKQIKCRTELGKVGEMRTQKTGDGKQKRDKGAKAHRHKEKLATDEHRFTRIF